MTTERQRATRALAAAFRDPRVFSHAILRRPLRQYQVLPARAILRSVLEQQGLTFAVMMSRQAGKNETSAQLEAMLLNLNRRAGGSMIKCAPTFRPQGVNSLHRLIEVHQKSPLQAPRLQQGYQAAVGNARISFFGAGENTSVVGATASILLEGDEAQDILPDKWNKDFRPMASSTNATTVLWGTAWTSDTLLATTIESLEDQTKQDGIQRVFRVPWQTVAAEVPPYAKYVASEIARLGAAHPIIRTQYKLETIDDAAAMFPPETVKIMHGTHPRALYPDPDALYGMTLDVAGGQNQPTVDVRKDSSVLTIFRITHRATDGLPIYRVQNRYVWTGISPTALVAPICDLVDLWEPAALVVDATGLGANMADELQPYLGLRLVRFIFSQKTKSELGWNFLGICNSGRFQDHASDDGADQQKFWQQVSQARYQLTNTTSELMQWGVPDPRIHDDELISAAMCAALPPATLPADSYIVPASDPLE